MSKIDLHIHTNYSKDCLMSISKLMRVIEKKGLNTVAITDHNEIEGALALKYMSKSFKVIIGEEIMTDSGEIIALFLKEKISPGLSVSKTVEIIKSQNGLVYIPHPFDSLRSSAIKEDALTSIISQLDIIEVFNSRNVFIKDNDKAVAFARKHNVLSAVGSDAHTYWEVGNSYLEMKDFNGSKEFLENLNEAKLVKQRSNPLVHACTKIIKFFGGFYGEKANKEVS